MTARRLSTLLLLISSWLWCSPGSASEESCNLAESRQSELQMASGQYREIEQTLQALVQDSSSGGPTIDQLERLMTWQSTEINRLIDTELPACDELSRTLQSLLEQVTQQKQHIQELQGLYWLRQPRVSQKALTSLWRSRLRLQQFHDALLVNIDNNTHSALRQRIDVITQTHSEQRLAFIEHMPALTHRQSTAGIDAWLTLWQQSLALNRTDFTVDPTLLEDLDPNTEKMLYDYMQVARLDALVMTNVINNVRGWLWKTSRSEFNNAMKNADISRRELAFDELAALGNILRWLYVDATIDFRTDNADSIIGRFFYGAEYLLGLVSFVALAYIARKCKHLAAAAQANLARRRLRSKLSMQCLRIVGGFSILIPWLVGLVGLRILESGFINYKLVLLLPLIPFARLYIIYGITRLFGEWLLIHIAERAGRFVTPAQSGTIQKQARRAAAIAMVPFLIHDFVGLAIGPSLLLSGLQWLMLAAIFVAISSLLQPWREAYILALQSFLPETIDPWVERLLRPLLMPIVGPLLSPVLLLALLVNFLHRGLTDLDWYRKLIARSFKLRSATTEREAINESQSDDFTRYSQWFGETAPETELPVIKVELLQHIQDILKPWIDKQSEENSVLLSGERGAGKSVALRHLQTCVAEHHPDIRLQKVSVPAKTCSAEAVSALIASALGDDRIGGPGALVKTDEQRTPTVVILEDAQNFFLREVGSLEGWETLLSFTKTRVTNIFWIVVINNQSWAYLSRVFGGDYQFSTVLKTRGWSQGDIRSLILSRHQMSGFKLRYDDILLSTRGPEAGSVRNAEQLYFSLLWDSCSGNPLLALAMWLSSVTVSGSQITVGLPAEVSATGLEHLGEELHFAYAALLIHENLSSEELVAVTALPQGIIRAALKFAFDTGLATRSDDRRYRITPLWYPIICRLLTRKNLLHE